MAKINQAKRIIKEDFESKYNSLIDKLGFSLNPIIEQLVIAFNKGITFEENLNSEIKSVDIEVTEDGIPKTEVQFQSSLFNKIQGILVIRSFFLDNKADPTYTISAIADISGIVTVTTTAAHGFNTGNRIFIENSDSTPSIDGVYTVNVINPTKFSISTSITSSGTFGQVSKYLNVYPEGYPFITFIENKKVVTIQHITGLPANKKFKLLLMTIGSLG
jgi:hypothetical protein